MTYPEDDAIVVVPGDEMTDAQEERMDRRFAQQEERMDRRFAQQEERMDGRFAEQEERMDGRFAEQEERMDRRFAEQEERVDRRFAQLEGDVSVLKTDVAEIKAEISSLHQSVIRFEAVPDEVRLLAEKVGSQTEVMERGFAELRAEMRALAAPVYALLPVHSAQLKDHDVRISALEHGG